MPLRASPLGATASARGLSVSTTAALVASVCGSAERQSAASRTALGRSGAIAASSGASAA